MFTSSECCYGAAFAPIIGKPYEGKLHVRFDEGVVETGYGCPSEAPFNRKGRDTDMVNLRTRRHRSTLLRANVERVGIGQEYQFDVEFSQRGNSVYVTEKENSGFTIGFSSFKTYEYIYEIKAPNYIRLDFKGDDGDVDIKGWREEIECRLDDGDLVLRDIDSKRVRIWGEDGTIEIEELKAELSVNIDDGDIYINGCELFECRLDMEDGDIQIQNSHGSFDITSDDGDVIFDRIRAERLYIRANDGNIDLDLLASDQIDADIKTDDGPVRVNLEKGFSTGFYAYSDDGRIRIGLENIEDFEDERHAKSGKIRGGKGRIRIRTTDGNITIGEM